MLYFFWDKKARLLLVAPQTADFDLIQIEQLERPGSIKVLGQGVLDDNPVGVVAFALPDVDDDAPLRLMVQAFPSDASGPHTQSYSRNLRLSNGAPTERAQTNYWLLFRDVHGINLSIIGDEASPPDVVSNVWASAMEGETLFPAETTLGGGVFPTAGLQIDYEKGDDGRAVIPVRFKMTFDQMEHAATPAEAQLNVYTLSANGDVLALLGDQKGHVVTRSNPSKIELKSGQAESLYIPDFPDVEAPHAATLAAPNPEVSADEPPLVHLDYLDRIVIDSYPPLSFQMRVSDGRPERLQNTGQVALVYAANGRIVEDTGALISKLFGHISDVAPETAFAVQMQLHDHYLSASDLAAASEPSLWLYSEVSSAIASRYDAAASRLKPFDIGEYLAAPSFFGLLASGQKLENLGGLTRALNSAAGAASERDRAGALGLNLIFATEKEANASASSQRIALWAAAQSENDQGWALIAPATREDVKRGLAAGLTWAGTDLGGFIHFLSQGSADILVGELTALRNELTVIGVLPMSMSAQFCDVTEAASRLEELTEIKDEIADLVLSVEDELRLHVPGEPALRLDRLEVLAQVDGASTRGLLKSVRDLFRSQIERILRGFDVSSDALDLDALKHTLASFFLDRIRDDVVTINEIVRKGYENPIPHNVIDLPSGFAEAKSYFRRPLEPDEQTWLFGTPGDRPVLVEEWRMRLRESYESFNSASSPGNA